MISRLSKPLLAFALSYSLFLVSCSTTETASGPVTITKVNPYHALSQLYPRTQDRMIRGEWEEKFYGAVTGADYRAKSGNYFKIFWETETKNPATVRLDYRQGDSGLKRFRKETFIADPGRKNVTEFQVIGDEYWNGGKVTQWKASIYEGETVVAEFKSFLWNE